MISWCPNLFCVSSLDLVAGAIWTAMALQPLVQCRHWSPSPLQAVVLIFHGQTPIFLKPIYNPFISLWFKEGKTSLLCHNPRMSINLHRVFPPTNLCHWFNARQRSKSQNQAILKNGFLFGFVGFSWVTGIWWICNELAFCYVKILWNDNEIWVFLSWMIIWAKNSKQSRKF